MMMQQPGRGQRRQMPVAQNTPIMIPNAINVMPIQFTGLPMLIEHSLLQVIAQTNCLMIVQCLEPLEIFLGIETPNKYIIHDMFLRQILIAHEQSNAMARECRGNRRNFNMLMCDLFGNVFMNCMRDAQCCSDELAAAYPPNNIIGQISIGRCCDRTFRIVASGCPEVLYITSPCCTSGCAAMSFPVMTSSGQRIAEVVRVYPGYLKDTYTDADTYILQFPPELPVHLKLILLSAVFLIDFTFFETAG